MYVDLALNVFDMYMYMYVYVHVSILNYVATIELQFNGCCSINDVVSLN